MTGSAQATSPLLEARQIRIRGIVQGVGFRPTVWRLAQDCGLTGRVLNDGSGVQIEAAGATPALDEFCRRLTDEAPPLSRIDAIEINAAEHDAPFHDFTITDSIDGETRTPVTPDAALCPACRDETISPFERRFRYPFTNCTHCGPRFSIIEGIPYDRRRTTMAAFDLCNDCQTEYQDPADRRFHAQPVACHVCGPKAWLARLDGRTVSFDQHSMLDDVDAITSLLQKGEIVAIKGIGGFHLACDATNADAVQRLRQRKRRDAKPFALMARDIEIIRRFCSVGFTEETLLTSPEAPIVLLEVDGQDRLPDAVAPDLNTLGFMLPYTPLHVLILRRMERPVVMTSGNLSNEPQITDNETARTELADIADYGLFHDRAIANRIDDSVVRIMDGAPRLLRRARGFAPGAIALPPGFQDTPDLLAFGGQLKATFCLLKDGAAILSQHQGDIEDVATFDDYQKNLGLYADLFDHRPRLLVADRHPDYLSSKLARDTGVQSDLPVVEVQHHHAHVASCMAENALPLDTAPVLGIALDGVGFGDDGSIWGGEFLLADYRSYSRLGTFKPVAMLGGAQAVREPWRNTYAHLMAEMGWARFAMNYEALELHEFLEAKPRETLDRMGTGRINAPLASSCGRLFDGVAAALGICRDRALFEGQGAMALEAAIDRQAFNEESDDLAYPFAIPRLNRTGLPYIEPLAMWEALLGDLILNTPVPVIAARFHKGLARAIAHMTSRLASGTTQTIKHVALTGGCFQNKTLLEETARRLRVLGFEVLQHQRVPANDGGIALGQAAIAAARALDAQGETYVSRDTRTDR